MMKEITLQDMLKKQEQLEESTTEPKLLVRKLVNTAKEIHKAAKEGEVKIVTDYDADGICSAYIIRALVKEINENANVEVICNDRRNAYGVPQELKGDGKSRYIVLDMGSNELEHIFSAFGDNTIVVDHHIIEDKEANISFERDSTLLNPHAFPLSDGSFSDYCATGLAQRLFFYTKRIDSTFIPSEKTENTIKIMGAIGTIADCVNVIDTHSYNRKIIRDGMRCIDNADKTNIEETIGVFLSACGLNKCDVTSQTIAFNVAPVINAASRMSSIENMNGAQFVFDTLTAPPCLDTYYRIEKCIEMNNARKTFVNEIINSDECRDAVAQEMKNDNNIFVYILPENTPTAMAGLIAGKMASRTSKAVIALTYDTEKGYYTGSCRNADDITTSLKEFVDSIASDIPDFEYGGHADAMGVSKITPAALDMLMRKIDAEGKNIERKDEAEIERLVLLPTDIETEKDVVNKDTVETLKALEPFGTGWKLPLAQFKGKELYRDGNFLPNKATGQKKDPTRKTVKVKIGTGEVKIKDWDYSPDKYPQFSDKKTIMALARLELNRMISPTTKEQVEGLQLTAETDFAFKNEYAKALENETKKKDAGRP